MDLLQYTMCLQFFALFWLMIECIQIRIPCKDFTGPATADRVFNGICYQFINLKGNYLQVKPGDCPRGRSLVEIVNKETQDFLIYTVNTELGWDWEYAYIGAWKKTGGGPWYGPHGNEITYSDWADGQGKCTLLSEIFCIQNNAMLNFKQNKWEDVSPAILNYYIYQFGTHGVTFKEISEDEEETDHDQVDLECDVPFQQLMNGEYNIIYAHPETFSKKKFGCLLRSNTYQENVCAVVVDEVHMVSEWGDEFRPDFKKVGELTCIFESAVHLALTATATVKLVKELETVLNYNNPDVVWANPDRPNICIYIEKRLPNIRKFDKFDDLIESVATELKEKKSSFPLTIMYVESLESLGYFYQYLVFELKDEQFAGEPIPQNRIFAQYHKDYPNSMKQLIVSELVKENPKLRLVLATVALGMGLNAPCIQRIIHCRPPTTVEKYMQEIGRAGRNGQEAKAIMYYNMSDISKSRKGLSSAMRDFCLLENQCYRKALLNYFGFNEMLYSGDKAKCCSYCKSTCDTVV